MTTRHLSRDDPCYRCGTEPARTMDHVFPKSLFAVLPEPGVTVPACRPCQDATTGDEIYLRDFAVSGSYRIDEAREVFDRVKRGLAHDRPRGEAFLKSMGQKDVYVGGLYLGTADTIETDRDRIQLGLVKIVGGLWYRETGSVWAGTGLVNWRIEYASVLDRFPDDVDAMVHRFADPVQVSPHVMYRFRVVDESRHQLVALLSLYDMMSCSLRQSNR